MNKIKRISRCFRILFQLLFLIIPILFIYAWTTSPESVVMMNGLINFSFIPRAYIATGDHASRILHVLAGPEKILGGFIGAIPLIIKLYMLYALIKLFKLYERGEIFTLENVRYIRNIAYAMLISQLVTPVCEFLMGIALTMRNPPEHRFAAVTLDQTNIEVILTALIVILISWIMAEDCKLNEEQQLTI